MSSDIKRVFDAILKSIEKLQKRTTKSDMRELGEQVAEIIRRRTRLGFGLSKSKEREKLARLEKGTIAQRAKAKLSPMTAPTRSNLTRSGQLLDALRCVDATDRSTTVGFSPDSRREGKITNTKLAKIHEFETPKRRAFFGLTTPEKKQVLNLVRELLKRKK